MADPIGEYSAALQQAIDLNKRGVISSAEFQQMMDKLNSVLMMQSQPEKTVKTPMPTPDPRGSTFRDRLPPQIGEEQYRLLYPNLPLGGAIPPELLEASKGIDPTMHSGDAMDRYDNTNSPLYPPSPGWRI